MEASGTEPGSRFTPDRTVDGDAGSGDVTNPRVHNAPTASRWSSANADHVWLRVDIAARAKLDRVKIRWGNTFSKKYSLLGSVDGETWTPLVENLAATARGQWVETTIPEEAQELRYLKVESFQRSQRYGLAIWEVEAYGELTAHIDPPGGTSVSLVTPRPAQQNEGEGEPFNLAVETKVVAAGEAATAAELIAAPLRKATGYELPVVADGTGIRFVLDPNAEVPGRAAEGYLLVANSEGVTITARTAQGLFYGGQSLRQLLGPWAAAQQAVIGQWSIPAIEISDGPRYEWRGFMLDVSRSFFTVDEVKSIIDQIAQYKLNVLHIHLTDDQGWRIAISNENKADGDPIDYERLTGVSGGTAMAPTKWTDRPGVSGFYTADEFKSILAYAAERHIAVIPEIDLPGHSNAALHAIPELNTAKSLPRPAAGKTTPDPQTTGDVGESALDADAQVTYVFIQHVLQQIVAEYPSPLNGTQYVHFGGDEPHKMKQTHPGDYEKFMARVPKMIKDLGVTPVAWNEAADAGSQLPEGLVIQHWNGRTDKVREYVNTKKGKLVLSPASRAYLPQIPGPGLQGPAWACSGPCTLQAFYNWDPTAFAGLDEQKMLGVEAPIWGEHLRSLSSAEYLILPRLIATAEVAWTPQQVRSGKFEDFDRRVKSLGAALTLQGKNFYSDDRTWQTDVREVAPVAENSRLLAIGALPSAQNQQVSAVLKYADRSVPVRATSDREFKAGVGKKFDDRQANGLFRFEAEGEPAKSPTPVKLVVSLRGQQVAEIPITRLQGEPEPTYELTGTVSSTKVSVGEEISVELRLTGASEDQDVRFWVTWGDEPAGRTPNSRKTTELKHTYRKAGTYTVRAGATDANGSPLGEAIELGGVEVQDSPEPSVQPSVSAQPSASAKPSASVSPSVGGPANPDTQKPEPPADASQPAPTDKPQPTNQLPAKDKLKPGLPKTGC